MEPRDAAGPEVEPLPTAPVSALTGPTQQPKDSRPLMTSEKNAFNRAIRVGGDDLYQIKFALDQIAAKALPLTPEAKEVVISRADYLRLMAIRDDLLPKGETQEVHVLAKHPRAPTEEKAQPVEMSVQDRQQIEAVADGDPESEVRLIEQALHEAYP